MSNTESMVNKDLGAGGSGGESEKKGRWGREGEKKGGREREGRRNSAYPRGPQMACPQVSGL